MKQKLYLIILCLITTGLSFGQSQFNNEIKLNTNFITSTTITPFNGTDVTGIGITGSISLNSDSSFVKVIVADDNGNEFLVYEMHLMLTDTMNIDFEFECEESCFFDRFNPKYLILQVSDASLNIESINWSDLINSNALSLQKEAKDNKNKDKLRFVQAYITDHNLIWVADETDDSRLSYEDKAGLWGGNYCTYGMEYYTKGFYSIKSPTESTHTMNHDYVGNFDWRNRHGANQSSSPYYDGDANGSGWMTPAVCQSGGCWLNNEYLCNYNADDCTAEGGIYRHAATCWIFGPTAYIEGLTNLYYNEHIDVDLSEQFIACEENTVNAFYPYEAFNFYRGGGVPDEECLPYSASLDNCSTLCENPTEKIKISNYTRRYPIVHTNLRRYLMEYGPVEASWMYFQLGAQSHSMSLVGWGVIDEDELGMIGVNNPTTSNWYGHTYWIYKESKGPGMHYSGFKYVIHWEGKQPHIITAELPLTSLNRTDADINCFDKDGDGYYYWGIGPKPSHCPPCPDEKDGDDSTPGLGPLSDNGTCTIIDTYTASFEQDWDNWVQVNTDDKDWWRHTGPTLTNIQHNGITGPDNAQDGDYYIYTENSSEDCYPQKDFTMESPTINIDGSCATQISFHYHLHAYCWDDYPDNAKLELQISYDDGVTWESDYWFALHDQGDEWNYVQLAFPNSVNKVRFIATTGLCMDYSDIALDNITIAPLLLNETPLVVNSPNTIWDQNDAFNRDIVIENGADLTIQDCSIFMAGNRKITVQADAKLKIDGGTITSACGDMWYGIVLLGDNHLSQTTTNQGKVQVYGVIENSKYGITNIKDIGTAQETYSGGIIDAFNATFRNNKNDILYKDFQNLNPSGIEIVNVSTIIKSTFETTEAYIGSNPDPHITFSNVNGFSIKGNIFQDKRRMFNQLEDGRIGINSYFSSFKLNEFCTGSQQAPPPATCDGDRNEFSLLKYGIRALGTSNPAQFSMEIKNSDFDCAFGVYFLNIPDAEVHLNEFTQRKYHDILNGPITYGLYLDHCRNYHVEANDFKRSSVVTSSNTYMVGVVVKNVHGENTNIYRNNFNDMGVATETIGQNKHASESWGLAIQCNEYENSLTDIYVTEDTYNPTDVNGIAAYQGVPGGGTDQLAGNLFGNASNKHINNYHCDPFNYYHHNISDTDSEQRVVPTEIIGSIGVTESSESFNSNSCPDGISTGGGVVIGFKSLAIEQLAVVASTDAELETLVDGGDTPELKQSVIFTNEGNAIDNYDALMLQEGYLSEAVMEEVATKETGLNQAMVRDVLVANPQAAKSKKVSEKLDARINPLPDYMRAQIQEGLTAMSPKEYLELQKSRAKSKHDSIIHKGMHVFLKDSTDRTDDLLALLSNTNDIAFEYRKLEILEAQNRTLEADVLLTEMSNMPLSTKTQEDLQDFTDLRNLLKTWKQQSKNMNALSETDLNSLSLYSDKQNKSAAKAMCLLAANDALDYIEPVYWPEDVEDRSFNNEGAVNATLDANSDWLKLYPNPAKAYVTVEYRFSSPEKPIVLKITDVLGKPVFSKTLNYRHDQLLIDTRTFANGSYWISIYAGSEKIKTQSLQIDK